MGLNFEELFQPDLGKEEEIKDFLESIEEKLKKLEGQIDNYRKLLIDNFNISNGTVELFDSLKQNNSLPFRTSDEIKYYYKANLDKGIIKAYNEEDVKRLSYIAEENSDKRRPLLKYYDYSSLVLTAEGKKDLNTLNYIDFLVSTQISRIHEVRTLKDEINELLFNAEFYVNEAADKHKIHEKDFDIAKTGNYSKEFEKKFNKDLLAYQKVRDEYWKCLASSNKLKNKIDLKLQNLGNALFKGKILDSSKRNREIYQKNYESIENYISAFKDSVPEYKSKSKKSVDKNIVNEEDQIRKENLDFQKGLLDEQYRLANARDDMNFNEQDLKEMSDSILLSGFLIDYSHRDYQRAASDYFLALEKERKQKISYRDEIEFLTAREETLKYYNRFLNTADTQLKSTDPNYARKVIADAQLIADATIILQYTVFDTLKFNNDRTTKTLASYIGLTQCVNKYADLLVDSERVPDDVREDYARAREQIMGFKQGLSQIMEKCYVGDKTTYNQILDQISNKQTYNSLVDTNKINRAFNKLTELDANAKTREQSQSKRHLLLEQKQKLIDVHDHILEFAKNEKLGNFDGISKYFSDLKREAKIINGENNHIGLVGKVEDQKAKDLVEDQLDSFTALSSDYSKKWLIGKLFNLGTYFKLNDMQKELANHYDNNFLKIVREGPGISQKTLTELVNGIEPTKENYKALMLYGTRTAFSNANFSQSIVDFNNRYASLEIDRLNRADVEKQLVILEQLNNKNSIQNDDVKKSQKAIVNEDIIEKDVHQNK